MNTKSVDKKIFACYIILRNKKKCRYYDLEDIKVKIKSNRPLEVYETSGYQYKPTLTIIMKGQWLEQFGFGVGEKINVRCEAGKVIVTRITETECKEN